VNALDHCFRQQRHGNNQYREENQGAEDGGQIPATAQEAPQLAVCGIYRDGNDDAPRNQGKERAKDQKASCCEEHEQTDVDRDFESATDVNPVVVQGRFSGHGEFS
jgi:hypothetical protein